MALHKDHGLRADNLFGTLGRVVGISMRERMTGYLLGERARIFDRNPPLLGLAP